VLANSIIFTEKAKQAKKIKQKKNGKLILFSQYSN
jgi:hypothetical protein